MTPKKNRYIDYFEYYFENKVSDESRHKRNVMLSTGVSSTGVMKLYRELLSNEAKLNTEFEDYVPSCGGILFRSVITYYERWLAGVSDKENDYFQNVCVTCGSTAAMAFVFDYLKKEKAEKVLLIGLQYFVYEILSNQNNIPSYLLTASETDKTIPEVSEIQRAVEIDRFQYLFLTLPMNPSGEKYSRDEFIQILKLCKKNDCILFLDVCQWEGCEALDESHTYYYGECIMETDSYQNTVIMDSFSKKRNIPGLRIGYVAGKSDVLNYVEYMNYITYCHQTIMGVAPIIIDYFYRMIYFESDSDRRKIIQKKFRKIILKEANNEFARYLLTYVTSKQYIEDADRFISEIIQNYDIYKNNYNYACKQLRNAGYSYIERIGGFNFVFLYNNPLGYTEKELKDYLQEEKLIYIFTQGDFCDRTQRQNDRFFIRITVADEEEEFKRKFDFLLETLKEIAQKK
ncbi:putative aminotransferase A [Clostridium putrefaciens]|uniref:Aminotransferase n=1 Tax=Clostridium putrefaciens TaxID=99675 RepID=A0A381J9K7_9CLOT|nr:pyridoxal phosphate-dependent aminotransferase [Clostridium putrefaciens]SUY47136.1 putative aminotransferase A [Clostridium putrefaciens]